MSKQCVDHLGNKFDSEKEMCQYWNIKPQTFRERQKRSWSLEKSLCEKNNNLKSCTDHLGNKFDSITDMCQYWNIGQATFKLDKDSVGHLKNHFVKKIII